MAHYKVCVLGDGGVGKTALTIQLCSNFFIQEYDPTIEDSYRKQLTIDEEPCMLEILDTAGQEEFTALRDQWIRDCEGFVIVYSITSHPSFEQVEKFRQQVLRVKDLPSLPIVIVGNKKDLESSREVTTEEGMALAKQYSTIFHEASAKTRHNVEDVFFDIVRRVRFHRSGGVDKKRNKKKAPCALL
eukprot:CAMPEP_0177645674 /NCGR_PEP_ID=MMETSP0447-20121125/9372_1 /TAXON_ID=0 /ORGANISM="Stygamoeba regulata, Strain BSH-02190019" /LENGTH=186 /DNA_ID=CAMNT_0019148167 /DNA_START=369 /DNA_END=929 /DNA_ORIENTATION=-